MAKEITLEGEVGWDLGVWEVKQALADAKGEDLIVNFSSPGGSVFQGITIYNLFKNYSGDVQFHIIGLAASMGSYIPLSGSKITAEANAVFMIHNARSSMYGDHNAMIKRAEILEGLSGLLAKAYIQKTGKSEEDIKAMMDKETFLFGSEIKAAGFVDEIKGEEDPDPNAKNTFVAVAKETFEACMTKLGSEKPDDYEQAAALLTDLTAKQGIIVDKTIKNGNNVEKQKNSSDSINKTATADNKKQERSSMNLNEFRAQEPAEAAAIDKMIAEAKKAGFEEGEAKIKAIIKKTSIAFDPEKSYPNAIQTLAKKVLDGEEDPAALTGAITVFDAQAEQRKSELAKAESDKLADTHQKPDDEMKVDGLAKTVDDVIALSKKDRGIA